MQKLRVVSMKFRRVGCLSIFVFLGKDRSEKISEFREASYEEMTDWRDLFAIGCEIEL